MLVEGFSTTYDLCLSALRDGKTLEAFVEPTISAKTPVDYQAALDSGRVLAPIDHPDPAHANVTGTGLTHLGSAAGRDKMHSGGEGKTAEENLTDSMKMFNMGLEGGKPESGFGVQPEWFYKGDGSVIVKPGGSFLSPKFALDGSEEPECVGLYVVSDEGVPVVRDPSVPVAPSRAPLFTSRDGALRTAGWVRARERVLGPRDGAAELPLPRALQAAQLLLRAGATRR